MDNRNNRNPNGSQMPKNTARPPQQRRQPANYRHGGTSNTTTVVAVLIVIALFVNYSIFSKVITKTVPEADYTKYENMQSKDEEKDSEQEKYKKRLADIEANYTPVSASAADAKCGELVLINKLHAYDFDARSTLFPHEFPVSIYENKNDVYTVKNINLSLNKTAINALNELLADFVNTTGNRDIIIVDGHRSFEMQQLVLASKISQYGEEQGRLIATEPGNSEHHTGYAIDLSLFVNGRYEEYYGQGIYDWITKNCYKYGFVIRYPEDKTNITGIDYEPWHLRYVGLPHAYHMTKEGLCLEEYIDRLAYYPIDSERLTIASPDGTYEVYTVSVTGDMSEIKVPKTLPYTLSGDNCGRIVVTVKKSDSPNEDLLQKKYAEQAALSQQQTEQQPAPQEAVN